MANEITLSCNITFSKGGSTGQGPQVGVVTVTWNGQKYLLDRQTVTTSAVALNLGGVTPGGWVMMVNRDATNYVTVTAASGAAPLIRMKPGEPCLFRMDTGATAPYVQANTANVDLEFVLLPD